VPIVIGGCGIAPWRLALFDFVGVVVWTLLVAGAGYFVGQGVQYWLARLDPSVVLILMAAALAGGAAWKVIRARKR
jgi:membrane protein DedA with SNARE-associated domain